MTTVGWASFLKFWQFYNVMGESRYAVVVKGKEETVFKY